MSTAEKRPASAEAPPPNPYEGQRLTGAEAVIRSLETCGVEICFGIPGGAILPIYDALASTGTTIKHVLVRHEQGAGHMAQGYARATGKVGVAMATSGPGATNLVTPVADAFLDSTPLVIVTGQVPSHLIGTDAFQEADTTGIFLPIVKHSYLVTKVEDIPRVFMEAFHLASTGRPGPVLIDIPKDIANTAFTFRWPKRLDLPGYRPTGKGHPLQIQEAALAIARAKKPVLYVGGGVINAGAEAELQELAEATRIPVVTTLHGQGRVPRLARALAADARHARLQVRQLGAAPLRPADHGRRALRRPRDGQARRVRARREGHPHGHRPGRDLQEPHGRRADRRRAARGAAPAHEGDRQAARVRLDRQPPRVARAGRGVALQVPVPLPPRGRAQARVRDRAAARPAAPTATRSGRPASASTRCGPPSGCASTTAAAGSPPAGSARWASASRPRSAPSSAARTRPSSASTATAASR